MPADLAQSISRSATPCAVSSSARLRKHRDRIDDDAARLVLGRERLDADQEGLRAAGDRSRRDHAQDAALGVRASRMPTDERLRMISAPSESKLTNSVRSLRLQAASAKAPLSVVLAVPGKPVIEHGGGPEVAAAEHRVEPLDAGRHALVGDLGIDAARGARDGDVETVPADHERRFVFLERRAAILLHAQVALRDAEDDAMVQQHGAVDHELHVAEGLRTVVARASMPALAVMMPVSPCRSSQPCRR